MKPKNRIKTKTSSKNCFVFLNYFGSRGVSGTGYNFLDKHKEQQKSIKSVFFNFKWRFFSSLNAIASRFLVENLVGTTFQSGRVDSMLDSISLWFEYILNFPILWQGNRLDR